MSDIVFEPATLADDVRADLRQSHLPLGVWGDSSEEWPPRSAANEQFGGSAEKAKADRVVPPKPFKPDLYGSKLVLGSDSTSSGDRYSTVARTTFKASAATAPPAPFDPSLQSSHIFQGSDYAPEPYKSLHRESYKTFEGDARPAAYNPDLNSSHILDPVDSTETEPINSESRARFRAPAPEDLRVVRAKEPDYIRQQSLVAKDIEGAEFRSTYSELGTATKDFKPSIAPQYRDLVGERERIKKEKMKAGYVDANWTQTVQLGDGSGMDFSTVNRSDFAVRAGGDVDKPQRVTVPEELYGGSQFKLGDEPIEFQSVSREGHNAGTADREAVKKMRDMPPAGRPLIMTHAKATTSDGHAHVVNTAELQRSHFDFGSDEHDLNTVSRDSFKKMDAREGRQEQAIATYAHLDAVLKVEDADRVDPHEWTTDYRARIGAAQEGVERTKPLKPAISLGAHHFELGVDEGPNDSETRAVMKETANRVNELRQARGQQKGTRDGIVPEQARETYEHLEDHIIIQDAEAGSSDAKNWQTTTGSYRKFEKDELQDAYVRSTLYDKGKGGGGGGGKGGNGNVRPDQKQDAEFSLQDPNIDPAEQFSSVSRESYSRALGRGLVVGRGRRGGRKKY